MLVDVFLDNETVPVVEVSLLTGAVVQVVPSAFLVLDHNVVVDFEVNPLTADFTLLVLDFCH